MCRGRGENQDGCIRSAAIAGAHPLRTFVQARQRAEQVGREDIDSPTPDSHNPVHPGNVAIPVPA